MTKKEIIEKYGEEEYQRRLEHAKKYNQQHKEELKEYHKQYDQQYYQQHKEQKQQYYQQHKEHKQQYLKQYYQQHIEEKREYYKQYARTNIAMFAYCLPEEIEQIENYEFAKKDNFKGWHIHHRLETHNSDGEKRLVNLSKAELIALDMYYNRPANELIFLTASEHNKLHRIKQRCSKANI